MAAVRGELAVFHGNSCRGRRVARRGRSVTAQTSRVAAARRPTAGTCSINAGSTVCSLAAGCAIGCSPRGPSGVIFDGTLLRDLIIQVPVVALLLVFIWLERRAHEKTITAMRDENAKLQQALIDHMNRPME